MPRKPPEVEKALDRAYSKSQAQSVALPHHKSNHRWLCRWKRKRNVDARGINKKDCFLVVFPGRCSKGDKK